MAQKSAKSTSKKKTVSKTKARASKSSSTSAPPRKAEKGKNPVYVLVIMGLVTAIALMVNRYTVRHEPERATSKKEAVHSRDNTIDKKDAGGSRDEKTKKTEKKEKIEKKEIKEKAEKPDLTEKKQPADKPDTEEVRVYFVKLNEKSEKMYLAPVVRNVPKGSLLENTMKELIKGPTVTEKKKGHLTAVPPGLKVNSVRIRNRAAEIDFNGIIEQGANGSILINRIDQIVYTATQFPNVKSVIIKINGKPRQTLGTDGLSIGGPLHRRQ